MRFSLLFLASTWVVPLSSCMAVTEGIEVDVAYQAPPTPAAVRTDMGYRIRLDRALIAVGRVELIRCDNLARRLWGLFAPARARAHEFSTPTSLGVPVVIDLLESSGAALFAGTLRPPPGRYCGLRVQGGPVDADAVGLSEESMDMMQHSVIIEGVVEEPKSGDQTPLQAWISEVLDCEMLFDAPLVFDSPRSVSISVLIDHMRWFDGIDFAPLGGDAVQRQIIENVRSSFQATRL